MVCTELHEHITCPPEPKVEQDLLKAGAEKHTSEAGLTVFVLGEGTLDHIAQALVCKYMEALGVTEPGFVVANLNSGLDIGLAFTHQLRGAYKQYIRFGQVEFHSGYLDEPGVEPFDKSLLPRDFYIPPNRGKRIVQRFHREQLNQLKISRRPLIVVDDSCSGGLANMCLLQDARSVLGQDYPIIQVTMNNDVHYPEHLMNFTRIFTYCTVDAYGHITKQDQTAYNILPGAILYQRERDQVCTYLEKVARGREIHRNTPIWYPYPDYRKATQLS